MLHCGQDEQARFESFPSDHWLLRIVPATECCRGDNGGSVPVCLFNVLRNHFRQGGSQVVPIVRQDANGSANWYVVQTRAHKEPTVYKLLNDILPQVFLPTAKVPVRRWGKITSALVPLFPCYLFAYFDYEVNFRLIKYTRGTTKVICAGSEPAIVPSPIIECIMKRCANGPVELRPKTPHRGEVVTLEAGALRGFEAVFHGYLSGNQRVAILLSSLGNATLRVKLPAPFVCAT
jgi:transcriptional antiterminator RfaH